MRKLLIILFISLLIPTLSISQTISKNTIEITQEQLKTTNLIFAEHDKWSKEIPILNSQIKLYQDLVQNYNKEDSLKNKQIVLYKDQINDNIKTINKLNKNIKIVKTAGISGSILLFLLGIIIAK
jgi:uncharacterized coiled-coil DUF342 family protein